MQTERKDETGPLVYHRQRPRPGWSYPAGIERLGAALAGVPNAAAARVWFTHGEHYRLEHRRRRVSEDTPLTVLKAEFMGAQMRRYDPTAPALLLWLHSVPSYRRHWVQLNLVEHGLPRLRAWLLGSFSETELAAGPAAEVLFREHAVELLWKQRLGGTALTAELLASGDPASSPAP